MSVKPSSAEEEYFARVEAEKKRKLAVNQARKVAADERAKLAKLHHMRCPKCGMELSEIAYRGVLVDKCFNCHGVFLDDGELEKLASEEGAWGKMLRFFARKDYSGE